MFSMLQRWQTLVNECREKRKLQQRCHQIISKRNSTLLQSVFVMLLLHAYQSTAMSHLSKRQAADALTDLPGCQQSQFNQCQPALSIH